MRESWVGYFLEEEKTYDYLVLAFVLRVYFVLLGVLICCKFRIIICWYFVFLVSSHGSFWISTRQSQYGFQDNSILFKKKRKRFFK